MIVTAAMTIVRRAENSGRTMSESLKRSLPNSSTESKGEEASGLAQKTYHLEEIMQLFDLITNETTVFQDKMHARRKIGKHLKFLRDTDPEW